MCGMTGVGYRIRKRQVHVAVDEDHWFTWDRARCIISKSKWSCVNPSAHITRNSPYRLIVRDLEWRLCVHCRPGCRYNWVEACYGANDPTGRLMYEKGIGKKQFRQSILRPDMVRAV